MTRLPIQLDVFGVFIFLGVVQGLFMAYFFLTGARRKNKANFFLGAYLLCVSLLILEIFLCHSNYMFSLLAWVDYSEPLNYVLSPLLYHYVWTKLGKPFRHKQLLHYLPFVFYGFYSLNWQLRSIEFKYNAYISAFHPELPRLPVKIWAYPDPFYIREYVNELTLLSIFIYTLLSFWLVYQAFRKANLAWRSNENIELAWLRDILFQLVWVILIFLIVKLSFQHDLGDHIIATHLSFLIYLVSFSVIRQSLFFQEVTPQPKKYEKSSLSEELERIVLEKLKTLMENEKPYLDSMLSLPSLAQRLNVSPHHLSQILNNSLKQNFFEYIAQYRIRAAQELLANPQFAHLKIDEIAEMVGYNSKSAFHTAFKKITQLTPAQYKTQAK